MTCMQTTALGAYVLGALDGPERLATEEHLRECAHCREELVRLAPLPGLLAQVSLDELGEPEGELLREPVPAWTAPSDSLPWWRRTRVLAAAAAVVAILSAVGIAGVVVGQDSSTETAAATWSTTPSSTGVDATATLSARGWGTNVELAMDDLPAGQRCRLVVWSDDGRVETAGWWTTGYSTSAEVPASTSIDLGSIDRMEVHAGDRVLAVLHP
jgi:putative zinc finger protein